MEHVSRQPRHDISPDFTDSVSESLRVETQPALKVSEKEYIVIKKTVSLTTDDGFPAGAAQNSRLRPEYQDQIPYTARARQSQADRAASLNNKEPDAPRQAFNIDTATRAGLLSFIRCRSLTTENIVHLVRHFGINILKHPVVEPYLNSQLHLFSERDKSVITEAARLGYRKKKIDILDYMPERLILPELYLFCCRRDGSKLEKVPLEVLKTKTGKQICIAACKDRYALALAYVPDIIIRSEIGYELCALSCETNGDALRYVPPGLLKGRKGQELCFTAAKSKFGCALPHIPGEHINGDCGNELRRLCIHQSHLSLRYIKHTYFYSETGYQQLLACLKRSTVGLDCLDEQFFENYGLGLTLCKEALKINGSLIDYVPGKYLDGWIGLELFLIASETSDLALQTLPERLSALLDGDDGYQFYETACKANARNYKYVKKEYLKGRRGITLTCDVLKKKGLLLEFVPEELLQGNAGQELCEIACRQEPCAIEFVPEKFLTRPWGLRLCEYCVSECAILLEYAPFKVLSYETAKKLCEKAFAKDFAISGYALRFVPDYLKNNDLYEAAFRSAKDIIDYITPEFFITLIKRHLLLVHQSPGGLRRIIDLCLIYCERLLPELIRQCSFQSNAHHLIVLTHPKVPYCFKARLIEWINCPPMINRSELPELPEERFLEPVDPLASDLCNPFYDELLYSCFSAVNYTPAKLKAGIKLNAWINNRFPGKLPACSDIDLARMNDAAGEVVGGRTIRVYDKGDYYHYKFQRQGESLDEFTQEGLLYQYLEKEKHDITLKSKIPKFVCFAAVQKSQLTELTAKLDDNIRVTQTETKDTVNVLCYKASENYCRYAHLRNEDEDDTYAGPEQGLLTACYDLGQMNAAGLVLTSVLPAFHCQETNRRWFPLHAFLGKRPLERAFYPGVIDGWRASATERPDIGYDGLRDLGDYELFGGIKSYFESMELNYKSYSESVMQRLAFSNAICEQLIAVILLRSRLRSQQQEIYHYKNPDAVNDTKDFIEQSCDTFLQGYRAQNRTPGLRSVLGLSETGYQRWLNSAAKEIVYWTAAQPLLSAAESAAGNIGLETYSHDILKKGRLCTELYPVSGDTGVIGKKHFFSADNEVSLGLINRLFPINFFLRGVMRLSIKIFEIENNADGGE